MSRSGLTQWAAVRRMRGLSTRAEQKPALPPPRSRTIATRSAKRLSGAAPTSARAGSRAAPRARRRARASATGGGEARSWARLHAPERVALQSFADRSSPPFRHFDATPPGRGLRLSASTIHTAFSRQREHGPVKRFDSRGFHRHGRARHGLPRRGLVRRIGVRHGRRGRDGARARRRGKAGLPQRGRDARSRSSPAI